jgi:hypothetical protein
LDLSVIQYPANSPYSATPQTSWHIGRFVFRPIPPNVFDTPFTLLPRHQYRPDRLSNDLYNTPSYWWVFCERNPFLRGDPVWSFVTGLQIMVPSGDYLRQVLGS